ncbi:hypothetical protein ACBI99_07765 [Nonomuraea sp. ATR24]|uniref:hypothetical protein n=1 Tax=Nonomuraea TaxID=83681 RepID=UPI001C5FF184|nr:hypothetical protein [Nonomuraea ceibae]
MEIVIALGSAAAVLFGADRLMLWLERHGHVRWRRTRRVPPAQQPTAGLDSLLSEQSSR